ncbi:hypothetical protein [Actinoplanes sp. NPDC026623]|uniref:hypothetical protein n=1 Tax=Actinoplanes sp. NPDC026623 TaxID=3155610 RepID=UPI0034070384
MPMYSANQIYGFARRAGFSPDTAATMTAIALAESGGESRAHGEESRGLWQIDVHLHPDLLIRYDLHDPQDNADAAYEVSRHGSDISPWTVTHGGDHARHLRQREEAQSAAIAHGDGPGRGVWTGSPGTTANDAAGRSEDAAVPPGYDGDQLTDAFEPARGLDPRSPDSDADGHLDGSLAPLRAGTDLDDLDDLDDAREQVPGPDPRLGADDLTATQEPDPLPGADRLGADDLTAGQVEDDPADLLP